MPTNSTKTYAIIILGMHRSGTSTLTRVCNLLGTELSGPLLAAKEGVNSKGFWELAEVVTFHNKLLRALGSKWDDTRFLPEDWWKQRAIEPYKKKLKNIVSKHFGQDSLWGIKDPRLCKLLPLWLEILKEQNIEPLIIMPVRNPYEVSKSLEKRDNFLIEKSLLLWLQHEIEAERYSRSCVRVVTSYNTLLLHPKEVMNSIAAKFDISWPIPYANASKDIQDFLSPELRSFNHTDKIDVASPLKSWVQHTRHALGHLDKKGSYKELAVVRKEMIALQKAALALHAKPSVTPLLDAESVNNNTYLNIWRDYNTSGTLPRQPRMLRANAFIERENDTMNTIVGAVAVMLMILAFCRRSYKNSADLEKSAAVGTDYRQSILNQRAKTAMQSRSP